MLFHTIEFLLFLVVVFAIFWALKNRLRAQNAFILAASYFFYGCWDWRFLSLIAFSSMVDYVVGIKMDQRNRNWLLGISLFVNLGLLAAFKYFDFFVGSLNDLLSAIGMEPNLALLHLITPVGISFYTFQTLSYTIDVYNRKIQPVREPIAFFSYVSFFPQLVAGPIERAEHLLPQFLTPRKFNYAYAVSGCRLFVWGLAKKVFVADTAGKIVDQGFADFQGDYGWNLYFYIVAFAFQIYCDFSGYTDMARGVARIFGFDLMENFRTPYFATSVAEFWRRWHISLTTWFRDYVYIPLGGSRCSQSRTIFNVMVVFLVSGFWHGANWTFIAWGLINALLFLPSVFRRSKPTMPSNGAIAKLKELALILVTFNLVCLTWIFFRADTLTEAFAYLTQMVKSSITHPGGLVVAIRRFIQEPAFWAIGVMLLLEFIHMRTKLHWDMVPAPIRWTVYLLVISAALTITQFATKEQFIYFQF